MSLGKVTFTGYSDKNNNSFCDYSLEIILIY